MRIFAVLALASIIAALVVFIVAPSSQGQRDSGNEPTVVQRGVFVEKEEEYGKEYRRLYPERQGYNLTKLAQRAKERGHGKEAGVSIGLPSVPTVGDLPSNSFAGLLGELACDSDAVVMGRVKKKVAYLTDDENFIFTEYEIHIQEVVKDNPAAPIGLDRTIQIAKPGGLVNLDGQVIRVEDQSYQPLKIEQNYLLFVKYLPSAGSYVVSNARGDFIIEENSFSSLSRLGMPKDMESVKNFPELLNRVNSSLSVCDGAK